MKGLSPGTELLEFERDPQDPDWYYTSLAINSVPCVRFSVATTVIKKMNETQLGEYLERQAQTMLTSYGDRRSPKVGAFAEYMEA